MFATKCAIGLTECPVLEQEEDRVKLKLTVFSVMFRYFKL